MAVYEMNRKAIANYLSNTLNEVILGCKTSDEGKRINREGYTYPVRVVAVNGAKAIVPKVDCFLNRDESITVRVYLPGYDYFVKTEELGKSYRPGENLSFPFCVNPRSFEYVLPNGEVNSYNDFKEAMKDLIRRVSEKMGEDINRFQGNDHWTIVGIKVIPDFSIYSNAK